MNIYTKPIEKTEAQVSFSGMNKKWSDNRAKLSFMDNRSVSAVQRKLKGIINEGTCNRGRVSQFVRYKGSEYSSELKNLKEFHTIAGADLDGLNINRDKIRDKKMLNVIGNRDAEILNPIELASIIYPIGKRYQGILDKELKMLRPFIGRVKENARKTKTIAPELLTDDTESAHNIVDGAMNDVGGGNEQIKDVIQWDKLDGINASALAVKKNVVVLRDFVKPVVELEIGGEKSEKQVRKKEDRQRKRVEVAVQNKNSVVRNAEGIEKRVDEIEPELQQSADEQYLRGGNGAKVSVEDERHLSIGKKSATKPLLEQNKEEAKGILWASVWSKGVNTAFIEGGTDAGHEFRLISPLPDELKPALIEGDIEAFKSLAKAGALKKNGEDPWRAYFHINNDKLTTLGEEIVQLLENGYVLEDR